jgi:hypothetical protein
MTRLHRWLPGVQLDVLGVWGDGEAPLGGCGYAGISPPPVGGFDLVPQSPWPVLAYFVGAVGLRVVAQARPRPRARVDQPQRAVVIIVVRAPVQVPAVRHAQAHRQLRVVVPGHLEGVHLGRRDLGVLVVVDEVADRDPRHPLLPQPHEPRLADDPATGAAIPEGL